MLASIQLLLFVELFIFSTFFQHNFFSAPQYFAMDDYNDGSTRRQNQILLYTILQYLYLLTSKLEQKVPIEPGTKMILYSDELLLVRISNQQVFCGCFKMIFILFIHNVDLYTHSILIHVTWKLQTCKHLYTFVQRILLQTFVLLYCC